MIREIKDIISRVLDMPFRNVLLALCKFAAALALFVSVWVLWWLGYYAGLPM